MRPVLTTEFPDLELPAYPLFRRACVASPTFPTTLHDQSCAHRLGFALTPRPPFRAHFSVTRVDKRRGQPDQPSIPIFGLLRQGDKSHTSDKNAGVMIL
jgi:hypothetical protein